MASAFSDRPPQVLCGRHGSTASPMRAVTFGAEAGDVVVVWHARRLHASDGDEIALIKAGGSWWVARRVSSKLSLFACIADAAAEDGFERLGSSALQGGQARLDGGRAGVGATGRHRLTVTVRRAEPTSGPQRAQSGSVDVNDNESDVCQTSCSSCGRWLRRSASATEVSPDAGSGTSEPDGSDVDTRLLVLGQLSELLGVTDVDEGLHRIAALAASTLADWCVIDRVDDGSVTRAALADRISAQPDLDVRLRTMPRLTAQSTGSLGRVLRGLDNVAIDLLTDDQPFPGLSTDPLDVAQAELFADLGAAHAFVVPLRARDHVLGALTWVRQDPSQPFTDTDILLATVFGFRVGLWLDNARLYTQQKRISEVLQRSLLTALPQPDRFDVAARYVPASTGSQIGGDWYDAVLRHDRHLTVTIGDVTGHDNDAAARMGQLRSMTRFAMLDHPDRPDLAVARVDTAMHELHVEGQATAVVAVVTQTEEEQAAGLHCVTWTNAGHLPPLVVDSDGGARLLETSPDLLLGVRPSVPRQHHRTHLEADETLVLYTDGLLERRNEHIDTGLARLLHHAADLAHLPLEEFCDDLLRVMTPPTERSDDIAIVAVRPHPDWPPHKQ